MANSAPRDANRIPSIGGASSSDGQFVAPYVDPITHRLYVDSLTNDSPATTTTTTQVGSSITNVTLKAVNASRKMLVIVNDSTAVLYVKFGATASATSYAYKLAAGDTLELPHPIYTGIIDGIWASANGFAYVTEY